MSPPIFFVSNVNPQDFQDEVYKIMYAMGVSSNEKDDLDAYQLMDVFKTC